MKEGRAKNMTAEERIKEFGTDQEEDYEEDDDEDYEYNGGDGSLYESRIDKIDELKTVRDMLLEINQGNPEMYTRIMSGISDQEQLKKF